MKYIVATHMRVGSTLIADALSTLLGIQWESLDFSHVIGKKLSGDELGLFKHTITKTHSAPAVDLSYLDDNGFCVIYARRNYMDTLVSRLLYEKNVRTKEKLPLHPTLQDVLNEFPGITDSAFCNLVVESKENFVLEDLQLWRWFTHTVIRHNTVCINYDKCCDSVNTVIAKLLPFVETTPAKIKQAKENLSLLNMQSRYTPGFVRSGTVGSAQTILDNPAKAKLIKHINQITTTKLL